MGSRINSRSNSRARSRNNSGSGGSRRGSSPKVSLSPAAELSSSFQELPTPGSRSRAATGSATGEEAPRTSQQSATSKIEWHEMPQVTPGETSPSSASKARSYSGSSATNARQPSRQSAHSRTGIQDRTLSDDIKVQSSSDVAAGIEDSIFEDGPRVYASEIKSRRLESGTESSSSGSDEGNELMALLENMTTEVVDAGQSPDVIWEAIPGRVLTWLKYNLMQRQQAELYCGDYEVTELEDFPEINSVERERLVKDVE